MCVFGILNAMKHILLPLGIFIGNLFPILVSAAPLHNHAAGLQPHQAVYDIALISKNTGTQILDITGSMRMTWQRGCDEWISDNETKLVYTYTDGTVLPVTNDYSTVENLSGDVFAFVTQRTTDQGVETVKGRASKDKDGPGTAHYDSQSGKGEVIDLPANTYFPMRHTLEILHRAAKQEDRFFYSPLFDGNDSKEILYVNTFIGDEHNADDHSHIALGNKEIDGDLLNNRSWDLQLAFFNAAQDSTVAEYEMHVRAYENGVVSNIVVDYGQFALRQNLVSLKKLEPQRCD